LVEVVAREPLVGLSVSAESTVRHSSVSKIVIMTQTVIILGLSSWIVQEYLNNMYLREYLSGVFQADGLIIGMLGTLLVLGSVSSLVFVRKRHGEKRFGAISLDVTASASKVKLSTEAATKPVEATAKPNMDFHPVVAALKADMADRRVSFGSMVGAGIQQPTTGPATRIEVQKTSILDQLTPSRQPPVTGSRPTQMGAPFPQQPQQEFRSQAPTGTRVEQGGTLAQRPLPFLRPPESAGSTVLQPSQPPALQIPTNVTTVITGIMPAQKKKDPEAKPDEKSASQ